MKFDEIKSASYWTRKATTISREQVRKNDARLMRILEGVVYAVLIISCGYVGYLA